MLNAPAATTGSSVSARMARVSGVSTAPPSLKGQVIQPGKDFVDPKDTGNCDLAAHGTSTEQVPMYSFSDFNELIGFRDVWEFERRYAEDE